MKSKASIQFATFVFGIAMIYLFAITFLPIQEGAAGWVDNIIGFIIGTVAASPVAYMLGSSRGSAEKNDLLRQEKEPNG